MKTYRILFIGDIVGKAGRRIVSHQLPRWKKSLSPDLVIANGENITHGHGISQAHLQEMIDCGVDVITGGNHSFRNATSRETLDDASLPVIRPANTPTENAPGRGHITINKNGVSVAIINLLGQFGIHEKFQSPFVAAQNILRKNAYDDHIVIVDFHAEATSEKGGLAWFLDGTVSAVIGTHTHVQTHDARILPRGSGFITDVGMSGAYNSILGLQPKPAVARLVEQIPIERAEVEEYPPFMINAVLLEIDIDKKTTQSITPQRAIVTNIKL